MYLHQNVFSLFLAICGLALLLPFFAEAQEPPTSTAPLPAEQSATLQHAAPTKLLLDVKPLAGRRMFLLYCTRTSAKDGQAIDYRDSIDGVSKLPKPYFVLFSGGKKIGEGKFPIFSKFEQDAAWTLPVFSGWGDLHFVAVADGPNAPLQSDPVVFHRGFVASMAWLIPWLLVLGAVAFSRGRGGWLRLLPGGLFQFLIMWIQYPNADIRPFEREFPYLLVVLLSLHMGIAFGLAVCSILPTRGYRPGFILAAVCPAAMSALTHVCNDGVSSASTQGIFCGAYLALFAVGLAVLYASARGVRKRPSLWRFLLVTSVRFVLLFLLSGVALLLLALFSHGMPTQLTPWVLGVLRYGVPTIAAAAVVCFVAGPLHPLVMIGLNENVRTGVFRLLRLGEEKVE